MTSCKQGDRGYHFVTLGKELQIKQYLFSLQRGEGQFGTNLHDVIYEWSLSSTGFKKIQQNKNKKATGCELRDRLGEI